MKHKHLPQTFQKDCKINIEGKKKLLENNLMEEEFTTKVKLQLMFDHHSLFYMEICQNYSKSA